jgi:hypothetical protein
MLHFLLIGIGDTPLAEISLMGFAMQRLASRPIGGSVERSIASGTKPTPQLATEDMKLRSCTHLGRAPMKYAMSGTYTARAVRVVRCGTACLCPGARSNLRLPGEGALSVEANRFPAAGAVFWAEALLSAHRAGALSTDHRRCWTHALPGRCRTR